MDAIPFIVDGEWIIVSHIMHASAVMGGVIEAAIDVRANIWALYLTEPEVRPKVWWYGRFTEVISVSILYSGIQEVDVAVIFPWKFTSFLIQPPL